jgi:hypothetical protein
VSEATDAAKSTCYWCGTVEGEGEAGLFIVHDDISGVCDRCVGYLMSVLAIDMRDVFENYVDTARDYSDNNATAREMRDAAKRLI